MVTRGLWCACQLYPLSSAVVIVEIVTIIRAHFQAQDSSKNFSSRPRNTEDFLRRSVDLNSAWGWTYAMTSGDVPRNGHLDRLSKRLNLPLMRWNSGFSPVALIQTDADPTQSSTAIEGPGYECTLASPCSQLTMIIATFRVCLREW